MINFKEDTHTYFDNTGQTYTSMTTVIGKYSNKFEDVSDFWEEYKAIQYLSRGFEDRIKKYNFQVHERIKLLCIEYTGNDFLFEHNEAKEILALAFKANIFNVNLNYSELITKCKKVVKAYWKQINIKSTTEGTAFHLEKEKIQSCVFRDKEYLLEQWEYNAGFNFKPGFMYNEVRLAHSKYLIAGTSDKIYVTNDSLIIDDWKGFSLDTPIATETCWKTIGTLTLQDKIFDGKGVLTEINAISKIHNNPCFKITFDTNDSLICDEDHKWVIGFEKEKETEMTSLDIYNYYQTKQTKLKIKCVGVELPEKELPIDPYVLGQWLADGNRTCGSITCVYPEIWQEIQNRGYFVGNNHNHKYPHKAVTRTVYGLHQELSKLNLIKNKHLPDIYKFSSRTQRLDLLRGLMDGDGYFHRTRKRCVTDTTQEWQAYMFKELLASLGFKPVIFKGLTSGFGKANIPAWCICFSPEESPFLHRNKDYLDVMKDVRSYVSKVRYIKSIEKVESVPTKCLAVKSNTKCYLVGKNFIKTHNTNAEIKLKGFNNQKLKYPLNNFNDCEYDKYSIQLGGYAFMLEEIGYTIKDIQFSHYPKNPDGSYYSTPVIYKCTYNKEIIRTLFEDFAKKTAKDKILSC